MDGVNFIISVTSLSMRNTVKYEEEDEEEDDKEEAEEEEEEDADATGPGG
jgi:hypothetical protein